MLHEECRYPEVLRARAPAELRKAVEVAADRELTTPSAYVRRAVLAALLERDGFLDNPPFPALRTSMTEVSAELLDRGGAIWGELSAQCANGPLPFVKFDPNNPEAIVSFWDVTGSGDRAKDLTLGLFYAELLVDRSKTVRGNFDPFQMIGEVLIAIAKKSDPGPIEVGFLSRIAMFAHAGSLN